MSAAEYVDCGLHGRQPFSFACAHIAQGLLDGTTPGFVCEAEDGEAYPVAWCENCDAAFSTLGDNWNEKKLVADYKLLCALCYLEARDLAQDAGRRIDR